MDYRRLGKTQLKVSALGFGTVKIGRNQKIKYPSSYPLPTPQEVDHLLNGVLDAGITLLDTAPAYGLAEQRIGEAVGHRRDEFTLCTKVGETFEQGESQYDFSEKAVQQSIQKSLARLKTDVLDIVLIHSDGRDIDIQTQTNIVPTLQKLRDQGTIRAIGFSGKTVAGELHAMQWADVLMVEYNPQDQTHGPVIEQAAKQDIGILIKKGLGSGWLNAAESVALITATLGVGSLVVGGLTLQHLHENIAAISPCR